MKKHFTKIHLLTFLVLIVLASCEKDKSPEQEANNALVESRWRTDDIAANLIWGGKNYHELRFIDKSQFEIVKIKSETIDGMYRNGSYTVNDKTVTLSFTEPIGDVRSWRFLLTDRITLERISETGEIVKSGGYTKYIRQN